MAKYVAKNFKFKNEGLGKVLGSLEQEIMEVLWDSPGATGKEVLEEIRRSRSIAVTTVFTVLERLVKKGLVRKSKGESVFTFEPVQTRDELASVVSREVLKGVFDLWSGTAMASFVDIVASKDPEELERLSCLISSKKEELEKGSE
ncbi:MAG: BlaI/MecI/CopY family transcriptional regulator [Thermodesulfobacteriota bacterium]